MANCSTCGKKLGLFNDAGGGLCFSCLNQANQGIDFLGRNQRIAEQKEEQMAKDEKSIAETAAINAILLTTETAPNLNITKRIEIITAECAFGMNIFKDLFAGIRDIVGGRSEAVQKTMRDARKTALFELKREAFLVGANAVVGVDLDYTEISANSNMIMLVASGTAVIIEV